MQEKNNSIKNDYLPNNMTANVNVEEARVQKLSLDESQGGTKLFNLTLGQILRENDFNSPKADKKGASKDITKEDNTFTEEQIIIQNERHIDNQEQKLDTYTVGRNADLSGYLLLRDKKLLTISTAVYETADIKATILANGIMRKDDIIAWVKEEEAILRSNEWNLIGGIRKFNEENRVSTDVSFLKGLYDASIPQEEETESHVDGLHYAEMKDSGYSHLVPLIYCTKVERDSDFDIMKNKARRTEAKEQTDPTRTLPKGLSKRQERNGIVICFALTVL